MKIKILFIHNQPTSFVKIDRDLLAKRHDLSEVFLRKPISLDWLALIRLIYQNDLVFGWFASWYTFLPLLLAKILGKPSILIIGGYDIANMPEIGYGHQRGGLKKWISRWTMHLATEVVAFSYHSQTEAIVNANLPKENVSVMYLGVPDPFGSISNNHRKRLVLTVGNVDSPNLYRKGHQPFVETAAYFPETEFRLVGGWKDDAIKHLRRITNPNVTFTGRVSDQELLKTYQQASVYVQASAHEGFGMSVAEAMLAGCIPVVTQNGSLPEVVGDCGVYAESQSPSDLASAIQRAFSAPESLRARARERILTQFPLHKRAEGLYGLVERLIN